MGSFVMEGRDIGAKMDRASEDGWEGIRRISDHEGI
jgi:hypothetical protein